MREYNFNKEQVVLILLMIFMFSDVNAQSVSSQFNNLSGPEKWWVLLHPFKAKKALDVSLEVISITDSIGSTGFIGTDNNGGLLDAFKHACWMANLNREIGNSAALKLGRAHEKGNFKAFKKGNKEEGVLPDKASSEMDLFNNKVGASISNNNSKFTKSQLIQEILTALENGALKIIKKDKENFLTCEGHLILPKDLKGQWENDKCLIPSNE